MRNREQGVTNLIIGLKRTRICLTCVLFLIFCAGSQPLRAQQKITIRLLHAKSGKPIANENVTLRWGDGFGLPAAVVRVDTLGIGTVEVPAGIVSFRMSEGPRKGKEPDRLAYLDCNGNQASVRVSDVLEHGVDPGNKCSERRHEIKRGEVIFWGLPRPWRTPDLQ